MKIELVEIPIKELVKGYINKDDDGAFGYDSRLIIRPAYQREFIYDKNKQRAVIDTIRKGFPLNVMYWFISAGSYEIKKVGDETKLILSDDAMFELLDGQQRTLSICEFYANNTHIIDDFNNEKTFGNLLPEEQNQILDYKLMIYICEGTPKERRAWFETINISGLELKPQELLNASYEGTWVNDAKRYFSKGSEKSPCQAYNLGNKYLTGDYKRQDYLETAISWVADKENITIENYMGKHQHDTDASILWQYYQKVINWVQTTFPKYRKEMKGINWGYLYFKYKDAELNANELEKEIADLMIDDDITKKAGIYYYVLDRDEKHLSIRAFTPKMKREAYERQAGICKKCGKHFELEEMEADHIDPWSKGGKTSADNCQMLCKACNRRKSDT